MSKKLFVSDVDGTLVKGHAQITKKVTELANIFVEQGNYFTLSTGRSFQATIDIMNQLPINVPVLLMTGSLVYDFTNDKILYSIAIDNKIKDVIKELMTEIPDLAIQVFAQKKIFTIRRNKILDKKGLRLEQQKKITKFGDAFSNEINKILLAHEDRVKLFLCKEIIDNYERNVGMKLFNADFASRHFFEVVSFEAGKEKALLNLANFLKLTKENIYVAGDGHTDIPMFLNAYESFAPEDALDDVKQHATYIIGSPKKQGIVEVFNYLIKGA